MVSKLRVHRQRKYLITVLALVVPNPACSLALALGKSGIRRSLGAGQNIQVGTALHELGIVTASRMHAMEIANDALLGALADVSPAMVELMRDNLQGLAPIRATAVPEDGKVYFQEAIDALLVKMLIVLGR
jgi:hypothetical protein